uniref:Ubiquitin-protein ligase n=1 Tax=Solanum tuberosum TaxID=4113 RepID=M1DIF3_SOLTU
MLLNLKWFEFYGTSKSICFKNAPMLRNVNMYLDPQVLTDPSPVCSNVTKFFHYMPSLQELELSGSTLEEIVGDDVEPDIQLLRAQSISCGVMKMLQRVEMQGFTGFEMEMEFMKIILASAPVLEEIFVWNMVHYIHQGTKMMDEMKQFPRVSPDVRFIFEEAYADPEFP